MQAKRDAATADLALPKKEKIGIGDIKSGFLEQEATITTVTVVLRKKRHMRPLYPRVKMTSPSPNPTHLMI
jgi:hypothetical protein